jgi:hypothetical protein
MMGGGGSSAGVPGVPIILDTDLSSDVGDAAAQGIALYLMSQTLLNIKGVVVDVTNTYSPGAADAINTYYGYPSIPIGANKGAAFDPNGPGLYAQHLAQNFTNDVQTASNATEGIALFRQLLAASSANSVTIIAIGPLNMLSLLLASTSDGSSALSGTALVAAKVSELLVMGGTWPNGGPEFNFQQAAAAADDVADNWPTPITFFGSEVGNNVLAGAGISDNTPVGNPIRKAHELTGFEDTGRDAWDEFPILYAAYGLATDGVTFFTRIRGIATVNSSTGANTWSVNGAGNHYYAVKALHDDDYEELFNRWLFYDPGETVTSIPALLVSDDFTGTNGTRLNAHTIAPTNTPATAWTEAVGTWTITGNAAIVAASASADHRLVCDPGVADVWIQARMHTAASDTISAGIIFNYQDASNFWLLHCARSGGSRTMQIFKCIGGSFTELASGSALWEYDTTYTVLVRTNGDNARAMIAELGSTLSTTPSSRQLKTATKVGFRLYKHTNNSSGTDDDGTTFESISVRPKP